MTASSLDRFAQEYAAGTELFAEGDEGDYMYVIQTGEVEIRRGHGQATTMLAVLPAGEFFGEMSLLTGRPRSATAVVGRQPARLLRIEPKTFEAMLRGKIEIGMRMIRSLAARLERANAQVELLLMTSPNHRVVQCLRLMAEEQLRAAGVVTERSALYLPVTVGELAARVALPVDEVADVLRRLQAAQMVITAADAGIAGPGFVIAEVGRLPEFVEALELQERVRPAP